MPSRSLKAATDLRARRTFGCWPAIVASCSRAASSILASCLASPTPMLSVTLTSFGACMTESYWYLRTSAARISSL